MGLAAHQLGGGGGGGSVAIRVDRAVDGVSPGTRRGRLRRVWSMRAASAGEPRWSGAAATVSVSIHRGVMSDGGRKSSVVTVGAGEFCITQQLGIAQQPCRSHRPHSSAQLSSARPAG